MKAVCAAIRDAASLGKVILVVSHNYEMLLESCDRVVKIENGGFSDNFVLDKNTVSRLKLEVNSMKQHLHQKEEKKNLFSMLAENAKCYRATLYASIFVLY
jgi:ABC-type sugar transport system ATPase subunit